MSHTIHTGDSAETLKQYPDCHFDSIVTDPPYGIEFLGKEWDKNTGAIAIWQECLRVLKPGGHLLAFSAARTYHHLATNIEGVGFEIRDQLMWIYASGFPKAQDIGKSIQRRQGVDQYEGFVDTTKNAGFGQTDHARVRAGVEWSTKATRVGKVRCTSPEAKQWSGWKTALKPAHEPIVMARKPYKGSTTDNVLRHGTGALNIDATRIAYEGEADFKEYVNNIRGPLERSTATHGDRVGMFAGNTGFKAQKGKVVLPQAGRRTASFSFGNKETQSGGDGSPEFKPNEQGRFPSNVMGEIPTHQKYFYCPKVTRRERMEFNNHPTVKPVALMRYLIQLVTPARGRVLDPFTGSGSTGMAAVELGHTFIGCELDPAYVKIAQRRIEAWNTIETDNNFKELFDDSSD